MQKKQNRLTDRIRTRKGEKLFCAFLTFGYPSLSATERLIRQLDAAGVDIIELGYPFSPFWLVKVFFNISRKKMVFYGTGQSLMSRFQQLPSLVRAPLISLGS